MAERARFVAAILGVVFATVLSLNYVLGFAMHLKHDLLGPGYYYDDRQDSPVYDDFPDKKALWIEHTECTEVHFEPYYHWRRGPYSGKYINIDAEGVRRTIKSPKGGARRVFMLGGSTMWGTGSPDSHTIPSLLQRRLGDGFDVYNFGEDGYVWAQELSYLLKRLADGDVPDVAIFYDGVNDGSAGIYSPGVPRDPESIRLEWQKWRASKKHGLMTSAYLHSYYPRFGEFLRRKLGLTPKYRWAEWDAKVEPRVEENVAKTMGYYEANVRQVKALAREYGFQTFFFWQPHLLSLSRRKLASEEAMIAGESRVLVRSQRLLYVRAKEQLTGRENEGVYFLGNILDDVDEPLYIDWCHAGPKGNEVVADGMYGAIKGRLSARETGPSGAADGPAVSAVRSGSD